MNTDNSRPTSYLHLHLLPVSLGFPVDETGARLAIYRLVLPRPVGFQWENHAP